jgi:hypothetical protein
VERGLKFAQEAVSLAERWVGEEFRSVLKSLPVYNRESFLLQGRFWVQDMEPKIHHACEGTPFASHIPAKKQVLLLSDTDICQCRPYLTPILTEVHSWPLLRTAGTCTRSTWTHWRPGCSWP